MSENIENVIEIKDLSVGFRMYQKPQDIIYELFTKKARHDMFWALKDISLSIKNHERVGIIGPNGAGKSTLLKVIAGTLSPSSGTVKTGGKVSALMGMASQMNPELSGLENIRFNLMLNGIPEKDIPEMTEEIIDFTEIGAFIYAPVKTYSTGMNARLSFAIGTAIHPEILIVDEILSVGDGYFNGKALKRMKDLCDRGKALLFVSHATSAVQMLCDTVIWLDRGVVRMKGPCDYVLKAYEEDYRRVEDENTRANNQLKKQAASSAVSMFDLEQSDFCRFRIQPLEGNHFHDIHYLYGITFTVNGESRTVYPEDISPDNNKGAFLDVFESEWGRVHSRNGKNCRTLSESTGKNKGGHFLINRNSIRGSGELEISIDSDSINGVEKLCIEYINPSSGQWQKVEPAAKNKSPAVFNIRDNSITLPVSKEALNNIKNITLPDVEILSARICIEGEETYFIKQDVPFDVIVDIKANKKVPLADVGIKAIRDDGVYTFWQSSGHDGRNLKDIEGKLSVVFHFRQNVFGTGNYSLSVYTANGFDPEKNYPYSEVFDRKVGIVNFTINRKYPKIDFGSVNYYAEITTIHN